MDPVKLGIPRTTFVAQMIAAGVDPVSAQKDADARYPKLEPQPTAATGRRIIDEWEVGRLEATIQAVGDRIVLALAGVPIKFSHPGKTKQTEGIADRLYCFPKVPTAIWWEWKQKDGAQRPGQVDFERIVTESGHRYASGGLGDFKYWLIMQGIALGFEGDNLLTPIPA